MHLLPLIVLISFVLAPLATSNAAVVYEQLPDNSGARSSSTLNYVGGSPGYRSADDFTLSEDTLIHDLHWWGFHNDSVSSGLNAFTFTFYSDNAGIPGAELLTTTGTLDIVSGAGADFYSSILADDFLAGAGTTYWLSIYNAASGAAWAWSHADGSGLQTSDPPGDQWSSVSGLAFSLTSESKIPEPTTVILLSLGLASIGFGRRQQHRRK